MFSRSRASSNIVDRSKSSTGLFRCYMLTDFRHEDGHYTALRKIGRSWWLCNDSEVTSVDTEDFRKHTQAAMILLKRKNDGGVEVR